MKSLWNKILLWIESGDLIFPIVAVSAAHYAAVLAGRDHWTIAFVIGVLVDLGHYRLVKASIRYGGWFWLGALVMTAFAFGFHFAFYEGDDWRAWMQAAAIPAVVIFLAMLSVRERWAQRFGDAAQSAKPAPQKSADVPQDAPQASVAQPQAAPIAFVCETCGAVYGKQQSYAAHKRHCARNGHAQREPIAM